MQIIDNTNKKYYLLKSGVKPSVLFLYLIFKTYKSFQLKQRNNNTLYINFFKTHNYTTYT